MLKCAISTTECLFHYVADMKTDSSSLSDHHYFGFIIEDRYLQKTFHRADGKEPCNSFMPLIIYYIRNLSNLQRKAHSHNSDYIRIAY